MSLRRPSRLYVNATKEPRAPSRTARWPGHARVASLARRPAVVLKLGNEADRRRRPRRKKRRGWRGPRRTRLGYELASRRTPAHHRPGADPARARWLAGPASRPHRRRRVEARPIRLRLPAGDQHHGGRLGRCGQPLGHGEAVEVGKLDIEQHDVRAQPLGFDERRPSVGGFSQDGEPLRLEQRARRLPERFVVVDDQHGRTHALIVAEAARERIVASPSRF